MDGREGAKGVVTGAATWPEMQRQKRSRGKGLQKNESKERDGRPQHTSTTRRKFGHEAEQC